MAKTAKIDLTGELAELMEYIGRLSMAIHMKTPFGGVNLEDYSEEMSLDVMWLSDAIRAFGMISKNISMGRFDDLAVRCDWLISYFERNRSTEVWHGKTGNPIDTFARHKSDCDPGIPIEILKRIKDKALGA